MRNKFLSGWNPSQDEAWLNWSSQSQIEKLSGWRVGDSLMSKKSQEMTNELLALRKSQAADMNRKRREKRINNVS